MNISRIHVEELWVSARAEIRHKGWSGRTKDKKGNVGGEGGIWGEERD